MRREEKQYGGVLKGKKKKKKQRVEGEVRTESKEGGGRDSRQPLLLGGKFFKVKHLLFSRFVSFVRCFGGQRSICSSLILGIGIRPYI